MEIQQKDLSGNILKPEWEEEWKDMPEFVQENNMAHKKILMTFRTQEDVDNFSKLIGQKISPLTKSINFPKINKEKPGNYLYSYMGETNEN
jgi:hypothetical protein